MKTISLLPPELKKKRIAQKRQNLYLTGAAALVLLVVLAYGFLFVNAIILRGDLRSIRTQRQSVEQAAAALEEYALLHEELLAAETLLAEAMGTVPPWGELLQEIGLILPAGVWLSEVTANYADDGGELTLRGWAIEHADVAAMLDRVYTLDRLNDVRCRVSAETLVGGQAVVQFTVSALVETGPAFITLAEGGR